jgi:hypothetical protein
VPQSADCLVHGALAGLVAQLTNAVTDSSSMNALAVARTTFSALAARLAARVR